MKFEIAGKGASVELTQSHFKTKGGEGSIYIKGGVVYKVCEAGKMIPEQKIKELSVLQPNKSIICPEDVLLSRNKPVGYTMRFIPNALPLAQILTKTYREREGVTLDKMLKLIQQIRDGIEFIDSKGLLQVDGNELNYMVNDKYENVFFIDVNSFQTQNYPADAIMLSVRDWHVETKNGIHIWTENSDWFSFGVVSFNMFVGIHPFKGRHPKFNNLKTLMTDQMKANVSVLNSESVFPKSTAYPFNIIPDAYMQWYRAIFEEGKRFPPPKDCQAKIEFVVQVKKITGSNNFNIEELYEFDNFITGHFSIGQKEVVTTKRTIFINRKPKAKPTNGRLRIGITPVNRVVVAAWIENNLVKVKNLETDEMLNFSSEGIDIMSSDGRIYVRTETSIYEIVYFEGSTGILPGPKVVANVSEHGTQMFQGVAFLSLFNAIFACIFPESGISHQIALPELEEYKIIDAKCSRNVLVIVGVKNGQYDRFVMRFADDFRDYDVRKIENINFTGINFTTLDNGRCILLTEEENLEIFSCKKDSQTVNSIDDDVLDSDMQFCHDGAQVLFANNRKLFKINMKKK